MGIPKAVAGYLLREHLRDPLVGPALFLGRQHVYVGFKEFCTMLAQKGLRPLPLRQGVSELTDMPSWAYGAARGFTSDTALLQTLAGIDVLHLDSSPYEGAEYIANLNEPVSSDLEELFGTVIDGGTVEHVFDVKTSLQNMVRMTAVGGRIIHVSIASNWIDHGFFHFSPTLFYDFYGVNGFTDLRCYIADQGPGDITRTRWRWYRWSPKNLPNFPCPNPVGVFFSAKKTAESTYSRVPGQGEFAGTALFSNPTAPRLWRTLLPSRFRSLARRLLWRLRVEAKF